MQDNEHVLDLLPAYALGSVDEAEASLIAAHLANCQSCSKELDTFQTVVGQLGLSAPDAPPAPDLKRRLMEQVRSLPAPGTIRERPARQPLIQRLIPVFGILGIVLILALSATSLLLWQQLNRSEVLTGPRGMRAIALNSSDTAPQSSGIVIISADGGNGVLVVDEFKQLDPTLQYQVWLIKDGEVTPGPAFSVDESGYRGMRIQAPESLRSYSTILVTIEPTNGGASPTGPQVLSGSLHNP